MHHLQMPFSSARQLLGKFPRNPLPLQSLFQTNRTLPLVKTQNTSGDSKKQQGHQDGKRVHVLSGMEKHGHMYVHYNYNVSLKTDLGKNCL